MAMIGPLTRAELAAQMQLPDPNYVSEEERNAWLHRPSYHRFPPLPAGYMYGKDYTALIRGKRDLNVRREAIYETQWLRTQFHDIYIMTLWAMEDEKVLVIEETEMNYKVEEWTSICTAMEEKTTYIVCEPTQMGSTLKRYAIAGNYINCLILKCCAATWIISYFWPHKRILYWPIFLTGAYAFLIYNDTFCKDPACDYQIVTNPFIISRFPLHRLQSRDATIMRYHPHNRRWFWQRLVFYLTCARMVYHIIFPAPDCLCDWRAVEAVVSDNIRIGKIQPKITKPWYVRHIFPPA